MQASRLGHPRVESWKYLCLQQKLENAGWSEGQNPLMNTDDTDRKNLLRIDTDEPGLGNCQNCQIGVVLSKLSGFFPHQVQGLFFGADGAI